METPRFRSTKGSQMWADLFLDHSSFNQGASANLNVEFHNPIQGLCLCVVAEVCCLDCWYTPCSSLVIGPRLSLERAGWTNKSGNGELEQLPTHFGSSGLCKRCCWNYYGVRETFKRAKILLTRNSWILWHQKCSILRSGLLSLDADSVTNWFSSISRLRVNLMKQWKTLQTAWAS